MFLCQIFFPSLGSRLPLIVTLSPKLWYLPFQNPNSPRRSKSLKHKNGELSNSDPFKYNNSTGISYETLGPEELRSLLTTVRDQGTGDLWEWAGATGSGQGPGRGW